VYYSWFIINKLPFNLFAASDVNPISPMVLLEHTKERRIAYFSLPWNPSMVLTSTLAQPLLSRLFLDQVNLRIVRCDYTNLLKKLQLNQETSVVVPSQA
jgi:hypothetical protein